MLILTNQQHFLTTYIWDVLNVNWKPNETITENIFSSVYELERSSFSNVMFESRISAGATKNYVGGKNLTQRRSRGPMTWKVMRKRVLSKML